MPGGRKDLSEVTLNHERGSTNVLDLESALIVGKGLHRLCYAHPENANLCIKVLLPLESGEPLVEAEREARYYRFLQKRGISWTMLPAFHGVIETTRGPGYLFDLVRDYDGHVSQTLKYYLSSSQETAAQAEALSRAFDALKAYLLQWKVITMTIKAKNILYQKIGASDGRLVIVDNIGNSDLIPICNYIDFLAERKIRRKWRRFEALLIKEFPQNALVQRKFRRAGS